MSLLSFCFRRPAWARLALGLATAGIPNLSASDLDVVVAMVPGADADIKLTIPGGQPVVTGFAPVRVRIVNRANRERSWQLELFNNSYSYGSFNSRQRRSIHRFSVPATSTREFFIYAPVPQNTNNHGIPNLLQGEINGPEVEQSQLMFNFGHKYGILKPSAFFALDPSLEADLREFHERISVTQMPRPTTITTLRSKSTASRDPLDNVSLIDPAAWPADWRLWSSFGLVILKQSTWDRLDTAHRRSLFDWVALGGQLTLIPVDSGGEANTQVIGAGSIVTLPHPLSKLSRNQTKFLQSDDISNLPYVAAPLAKASFWDLPTANWGLTNRRGWLTIFIAVFGLLIGPVNVLLLAPQGKRHRLFVTVPAISLVATATLFGIITVGDGFGGEGTRRALVVLLPEHNQAAVFQSQISRTGLLTQRTFPLPADTMCDRESTGTTTGTTWQLRREGDQASGDWFSSRSTQQHTLRRLTPTRERVELVSAPGTNPTVQSTVTTTLQSFVFRDDSGDYWSAAEVAPGTKVMLTPSSRDALTPTPASTLARGHFSALGGGSEIAPLATLPSIRWRDDRIFYTGRLTPEVTP